MKTLYLDIFSGISGDMFLGALIDLGVDVRKLEKELQKVALDGYHLHVSRAQKSGIEGVKFDVHGEDNNDHDHDHDHGHHHHDDHDHEHHHHEHGRTFTDIKALIARSKLSSWVKGRALA